MVQKVWTHSVSILCQSRLFLLPCASPVHSGIVCAYPSSVNRGYFSYLALIVVFAGPVFVSILCQSRLFLLPAYCQCGSYWDCKVSILCQSRLFLLPADGKLVIYDKLSIHPLSIEAISPTSQSCNPNIDSIAYPSSVNRGYFSYGRNRATLI